MEATGLRNESVQNDLRSQVRKNDLRAQVFFFIGKYIYIIKKYNKKKFFVYIYIFIIIICLFFVL